MTKEKIIINCKVFCDMNDSFPHSFSVNSLFSEQTAIFDRNLRLSWAAARLCSADLQQIPILYSQSLAHSNVSQMSQQNEKPITKLETNINGTSRNFESTPPYPSTTIYNGLANHAPKVLNESWQNSNATAENKMMGNSNNAETHIERNNWNPAFAPCGYKRNNFLEPCTVSNNMKKEPNGVYQPSETTELPHHEKSSNLKAKRWNSPGGSDTGKLKFVTERLQKN